MPIFKDALEQCFTTYGLKLHTVGISFPYKNLKSPSMPKLSICNYKLKYQLDFPVLVTVDFKNGRHTFK